MQGEYSAVMMQGDAYPIEFEITYEDGTPLTADDIDTLEVNIGALRFAYLDSLTFDSDDNVFRLDLTQDQTFSLRADVYPVTVRIKSKDKTVCGYWEIEPIRVVKSVSKEIL